MTHDIPAHVNNSTIEFLIAERIRNETNREILRDKWFRGKSFYQIARDYGCSITHVKDIVWGFGDALLLEAADMDAK